MPGRHTDITARRDHSIQSIRRSIMNRDILEGNWKQLKGKVKVKWGKLTDDDLDVVEGRRDVLAGKIQERYGISKDEAEAQLDAWDEHSRH
jgi:uncharacterized protein YjbJ (UPF0337 family)